MGNITINRQKDIYFHQKGCRHGQNKNLALLYIFKHFGLK